MEPATKPPAEIEGKKAAYRQQMEAQFKEWSAKIDALKAKAEKAEAKAKVGYYETIEQLRAKQEQVRQKLDGLKQAGAGAWDDVKGGVEKAWTDLKAAVDRASGRMK
jgi:uncharacterized protein with von Willebrand factor type A (vWA) domain